MRNEWASDLADDIRDDVLHGKDPGQIVADILPNISTLINPYHRQCLLAVLREISAEPTVPCGRGHGEQELVNFGVSKGFAGGPIYWANLACRCFLVDESHDVAAAY